LSFFGVLSLLVALSLVDALGWSSLPVIGGFFGSVVLLAAFFIHESRTPDPLVDLGLFSVPDFSPASAGTGFAFLVLAGSNFVVPFYLQLLAGLSPQHAGLVLLLYSVSYILVTPFAGRAADRVDPALLCFAGMVSAAGAFAFFAVSLAWGGLVPVAVFLLWLGVSYGLFFSPNNTLVMGAVPQERQGVASGVFSAISRLSIVLGVSMFEAIYAGFSAGSGGSSPGSGKNMLALEHGFRAVYLFGAVLSMVAAVFSALLVKRRKLLKSI
jgi:MFS family permease